jgi:nitroreductase
MHSIIDALSWRYATQQFDPSKKLAAADRELLLEATRLAPSSFGLQPWKLVVVETPKLREQIRAAAWNQAQVTDASDVIVLCTRTTLDEAYVDHYLELIATTRSLTIDKLDGLKKMILGSVAHRSKHEVIEWNKRQTYIALGVLLSTAALHIIDASPMEGFDPLKVDEILGLTAEGYTATVLCALGYRHTNDPAATQKKVRLPIKEIIAIK